MYRESAQPDSSAPAELLYEPVVRNSEAGITAGLMQVILLPMVAGIVVAQFFAKEIALGVGIVVGIAIVHWRRRAGGGVVLQVRDGALIVERQRSRVRLASIRLIDLLDVALDSKEEKAFQTSTNMPAVAFNEHRAAPSLIRARIVLVGRSGEVPLTEEPGAHMDAVEQVGKIRVFLRRHGWLPDSEREEAPDSSAVPSSG